MEFVADLFLLMGVVMIIVYIIFEFQDKDFYSKKKLQQLAQEQAKLVENEPIKETQDGE